MIRCEMVSGISVGREVEVVSAGGADGAAAGGLLLAAHALPYDLLLHHVPKLLRAHEAGVKGDRAPTGREVIFEHAQEPR